jgi:hypothetical protein
MKSKLLTLTLAACMALTIKVQAQSPATLQAPIVNEAFDNWTGSTPNNWMISPATTIPASGVSKTVTTNTTYPVYGAASCNLVNTNATTYSTMATNGVSVTAGMGYQISYRARGKGTITAGVTDGGTVTVSANGTSVKGANWYKVYQTVIAPTTTTNAQFYLKAKATGTYTTSGFSVTGIDVDSFKVQPYVIPTNSVSLSVIQTTTATPANSPFYAQYITKTGGIVTCKTVSTTGPSGYYIQTTGSTAWGAALVYDPTNAANIALGDSVTFQCSVDEYYNMTELQSVTNFVKVSTGNPVPAPMPLMTAAVNQEMYEGFLVELQGIIIQSYTTSYGEGTALDAASSGVPCVVDFKSGFYPPNGTGAPGYVPTYSTSTTFTNTTQQYCVIGNVDYNFQFNVVPRDSADIMTGCTMIGIEKYSNTLSANVYPNPTNNELTIKLPFTAQKVNISFVDVLGNEVMSTTTSGSVISVKEINLPAGVYMVKIVADGKTQLTKIIKQ